MTFGGAASEAAKGLSAQPIFLLVAVLNLLMVGALIYVAKEQSTERGMLTTYLIECHKTP